MMLILHFISVCHCRKVWCWVLYFVHQGFCRLSHDTVLVIEEERSTEQRKV